MRLCSEVAVDPRGKRKRERADELDVYERRRTRIARRLLGRLLCVRARTETKRVGYLCSGTTDAQRPARLRRQAAARRATSSCARERTDAAATRDALARRASGCRRGAMVVRAADTDRIDLLPEKSATSRARPRASRCACRSARRPRSSRVEREGVLDAWVTKLSGREPVIEIPIKDRYAPNMFVSADASCAAASATSRRRRSSTSDKPGVQARHRRAYASAGRRSS